jgi:undecaprenyl-diphosphatase
MGLHLFLGILLLVGAAWMFGGIAEDVVTRDHLTVTDKHIAEWFNHRATPGLKTAMQVISGCASPLWITVVVVITGLILWRKRCWYQLLDLALVVPGGMALLVLLKLSFHRHRPSFEDALSIFQGYSFPSGHTMGTTLLYGALAAFAVQAFDTWRWRTLVVLGAFAMMLLVGFSRMYLGAHYLSDVLAAFAAGLTWLACCFTAVGTLRRNRNRTSLHQSA